MRLLFIVLLVLAGSVTFGQKSKVSVKFTIDPQTDVFSEFEDEIIEIQNAIRDSIVRTLNAIYAYADFVTTTSSNQLAVKLVRRSSTNEEFDDMYFSGTLGAS